MNEVINEKNKMTILERSVQTKMLLAKLREHKEGDVVRYEEFCDCIGENVQKGAYSYLASARKIVLSEDGARWESIHKVGLKCLNPSESLSASSNLPRKIQRTIRREKKKIQKIKFSRLNNDERNSWNLVSTYASLISYFSKEKSQNVLKERVQHNNAELPPGMAMENFKTFK